MILETKNKKINLVLRTKKIVNIANSLKSKNFEDAYFKAIQNNDLDAMSKIIYTLAENEDGKYAFNSSDDVYDFLDEYRREKNKTYSDIFQELTEVTQLTVDLTTNRPLGTQNRGKEERSFC